MKNKKITYITKKNLKEIISLVISTLLFIKSLNKVNKAHFILVLLTIFANV